MGRPYVNYKRIAAAVTPDQADALKRIADRKGVSQQDLIREGIEMAIKKYRRRS